MTEILETVFCECSTLGDRYHEVLFSEVIPFWEEFSMDSENGGYYTCLDEYGKIYDTDKFTWLQARQIWMFSKLVNSVSKESLKWYYKSIDPSKILLRWFNVCLCGVKFLQDHVFDVSNNNCYFSLDRTGKPLIQPYSIFSDCFVAMAFTQFHKAVKRIKKDKDCSSSSFDYDVSKIVESSWKSFEVIEKRKINPKGLYSKAFPGTREEHSLAVPMIDINICLEFLDALDAENEDIKTEKIKKGVIIKRIIQNLNFIFSNFVDSDRMLLRETSPFRDTFSGRLVNPGHSIECVWFILYTLEILKTYEKTSERTFLSNLKLKVSEIEETCEKLLFSTLEFGWDKKFGGIFYFLDILEKPVVQLEWDQKLWWVHFESLISLLKFLEISLNKLSDCDDQDKNKKKMMVEKIEKLWDWFKRIDRYVWDHFYDKVNKGEFWGYLNRRGEVLIRCKGGKWKGCFHVPRGLLMAGNLLSKIGKMKKL